MITTCEFGPWSVAYALADGGRLTRLQFRGVDLLTSEPHAFHQPRGDYGSYETRPVFGYDDCFPTVDACSFPGLEWQVPDHGELCWLDWQVEERADSLVFSVASKVLPWRFQRQMYFSANKLTWTFEVDNAGDDKLPFLHVMHPLMPLAEIANFELPAFESVYDEISGLTMDLPDAAAVREFLLDQSVGSAQMLILRNIKAGEMRLQFKNGVRLVITFSPEDFRSLGVWWNNHGYPPEDNCRRSECAFEPIAGPDSVLTHAYESDTCFWAMPRGSFTWQVHWCFEEPV
jgi:galactose mutarotase-like enzyme